MKNNKGFTLVELLATLIILSMVLVIGTYSITTLINNSKEKNYKLLVDNIINAAEGYYQECKFSPSSKIDCDVHKYEDGYKVSLGDLVKYGHLKGNKQDSENQNRYTIENPRDNKSISDCEIIIKYSNGSVVVTVVSSSNGSCPNSYDKNANS